MGIVEGSHTWEQQDLKLLHYVNGGWQDVTTSVDTTNHTVTGVTTSFSPFGVYLPSGSATNTPASSVWSLALMALLGLGLAGAIIRRREADRLR